MAAAFTLSIALAGAACFGTTTNAGPDIPFSSAGWKQAGDSGPRLGMLADLRKEHHLLGLSRAQVEALLGAPDTERWSKRSPHPAYSLGTLDSLSEFTTIGLVLRFDEDGRVEGHCTLPLDIVPKRYVWNAGASPFPR